MNPQAALYNIEELLISIVIILGSALPFIIYHLIQRKSRKNNKKEVKEQEEAPPYTEPRSILEQILSRGRRVIGREDRETGQVTSSHDREGLGRTEASGRLDRGRLDRSGKSARSDQDRESGHTAWLKEKRSSRPAVLGAQLGDRGLQSGSVTASGKQYSERVIKKLEKMSWPRRAIVYAEIFGPPKALIEGTMSITNHADNKNT